MLEASVIICTHNPQPAYLERVLQALRGQTLSAERWELIVVDNGSKQKVADIADISWHERARLVQEPQLGLAFARQRGIAETSGQLLVFVDDDNVLAADYLENAVRISDEYKFLGAWGSGGISLEFEAQPADHLTEFLPWLGLRHADKPIWSNAISCDEATPIGAGLCVRRQIAEAYSEFFKTSSIQITGRKGTALGGHEDFEICYLACEAGLGMAVFPELKILHLIAARRVTDDHIVKLVESVTTTKLMLSHKWGGHLPRSPVSLRGLIFLAINVARRGRFERRVYFAEQRAVMAARRLLIT